VKKEIEKVKNVTFLHQFQYYIFQVYSEAEIQLRRILKSTLDEG